MTVGTCLDHPHLGKTQLFRRNVDFTTLYEIFSNPRVHTNKGYHNADKRRKISSVSSSSFDSSISSSRSGTDSDGCIYPEGISEIPSNLRSDTSPYLLKVISQDGISVREGVELDSKFIDNRIARKVFFVVGLVHKNVVGVVHAEELEEFMHQFDGDQTLFRFMNFLT